MRGWEYAEVCPIYQRYQYESYSGQGLINIAQELLEGTLQYEEDLIAHIYTCTTCGACDINCKSVRDMEVLDTILALRAKCVEDGRGPMAAHRQQAENAARHHNIYGKPHNRRFDWLPENFPLSKESNVAFFVGCAAAYLYPESARDAAKILSAGGVDFRLMFGDEFCCGAPLWRTGQAEAARKLAERNMDAFRRSGVDVLITGCAHCYGTFRGFYPRIAEPGFKVLHITEVLWQLLQEGRLKPGSYPGMRVTYHDPCLLGRLSEPYVPWTGRIKAFGYHDPPKQWRRGTHGVYDAPRCVLRSIPGIELVEMTRNEENAFCCGGGGGVPSAFPDFALWVAGERIGEARAAGAEALVSSCPFCRSSFENALAKDGGGFRYHDLCGLVAASL
jgi:Fe-S oxidoreductase